MIAHSEKRLNKYFLESGVEKSPFPSEYEEVENFLIPLNLHQQGLHLVSQPSAALKEITAATVFLEKPEKIGKLTEILNNFYRCTI